MQKLKDFAGSTARARFARDERGSVTMQVLFFSLLLFITTALVLDSGSTYSKHSQMQAFTDQMALAAASELDGTDDAIERATAAVFGRTGEDSYLSDLEFDTGRYEVDHVAFFSTMVDSDRPQNDMSEAFTAENLVATAYAGTHVRAEPTLQYFAGSAAEASNLALYAVVKARDTADPSIASQFIEAFTQGGTDAVVREGEYDLEQGNTGSNRAFGTAKIDAYRRLQISSVSAASLSRMNCADLSPLVFCNPWEDQQSSPLDVPEDDSNYSLRGRSLQFFAPNFNDPVNGTSPQRTPREKSESPVPWDVNHQLFKLTNPVADAGGVCNPANIIKLSGIEDYEQARDRCLMAKAQHDTVCWGEGEELTIKPAHGPDVLRAVNTIFDIWHAPFNQVVSNTTTVGSTGMTYNMFFEPDALATTIFEPADRHGDIMHPATTAPIPVQDGNPEYHSDPTSEMINIESHTTPGPGYSTLFGVYFRGSQVDICHGQTAASYDSTVTGSQPGRCAADFIGDHYEGASSSSTVEGYIRQYWETMYTAAGAFNPAFCGTSLEGSIPGLAEFCEAATIPTGSGAPTDIDTWYELYQRERALMGSVATDPGVPDNFYTAPSNGTALSRVQRWGDGTNGTADYVSRYGLSGPEEPFVKHTPDDYMAVSGAPGLFLPGRERRRLRAPMVNCSAATVPGNSVGQGNYRVDFEDLRIVDVYVPQPATQFCGTVNGDGTGTSVLSCPIDTQKQTTMFIEMIQNVTDDVALQHYTAHLVR